jgi:hypothetical protein
MRRSAVLWAAILLAVTTAVASAAPGEENPTCPKLGLTYASQFEGGGTVEIVNFSKLRDPESKEELATELDTHNSQVTMVLAWARQSPSTERVTEVMEKTFAHARKVTHLAVIKLREHDHTAGRAVVDA